MKFSHAICARIPNIAKFEDKKAGAKIDLELARKQQEDLNDTLREAGVELIELPTEDHSSIHGLFVDDAAIVINGTALITRPKKAEVRISEILAILQRLVLNIVHSPLHEHGKLVVLEGSDVVYTGKEIFVGIRKNGTNTEGALILARTFADLSVIPIPINGTLPLKYYVSLAASNVLAISSGKESQAILKRIERDATYRYKVLTLKCDEAINCINVNNHLIFRHDLEEVKFRLLTQPTELWGVGVGELVKIQAPFSKFCLLVQNFRDKSSKNKT